MSTPAPPNRPPSRPSRIDPLGPLAIATIATAAIVALSVLWMASESHYRSCVAKVNSKYPAVAVSAFNGRQTGPLKVSFTLERQRAVGDCSHLF